jgi:hypothetical protein
MSMKWAAVLSVLSCIERAGAQSNANLDQFNYRGNEFDVTNDYGPQSWQNVRCTNLETCVSRRPLQLMLFAVKEIDSFSPGRLLFSAGGIEISF